MGQTKQNPFTYPGSGKYWQRHLQKHGPDVETTILQKCYSKISLREWGVFYSKLWNIVESKRWANLKPEEGDGWGSGIHNPMNNTGIREKHRIAINTPAVKEKHRQAMIKLHASPDYKKHRENKLSNCDKNVYKFYHVSGITEECTRVYLQKKYNLPTSHVTTLMKGTSRCQSVKGWKLLP